MFFRKSQRKQKNFLDEEKKLEQNSASKIPDKEDVIEYNMYLHEQDMKRRRAEVENSDKEYERRRQLKEKIFEERAKGNVEFFGGSIDHSNCSSRKRTIVFSNVKVFKYPAIITYEFEEYTGYAFGYENCTGRGKNLQECLNEIGMDLRYPLQDFYNDNGYIPSYSRNQILQDSHAFLDIKNGAKIKLVNVEIET